MGLGQSVFKKNETAFTGYNEWIDEEEPACFLLVMRRE